MPRALVIGSGVAGPASALFLQRAGWDVEVFEAAAAPDAFTGLFLNAATNGLAVLDRLGLRDALIAEGHRAPEMVMWSGTGRRLGSVPNGPAREPERGSVIVTRSALHRVLRDGLAEAGIPVRYGARLTAIDETGDQSAGAVRATFADGTVATGDILIGADGINSPTRTYIDPAAPAPRYSGLVGLGGFSRVDGLAPTPESQHLVFGRRSFFGYLVRTDGTVYWFANITAPEPARGSLRDVPSAEWMSRLADLHADDAPPVPAILAGTTSELSAYPIFDLSGVPHWSRGRVVAIGDAVHATSPSSGQGASLALEDAAALARCLGERPDDRAAAFAAFEAERRPRADAVIRYARAIDKQKRVTSGPVGIAIRDAMMPLFLRKARDDTRNDWLYNSPTRDA